MSKEPLFVEGEEWRNIPDFPGYQVSNYGRVKSLERISPRFDTVRKVHRPIKIKEKIRKQYFMPDRSTDSGRYSAAVTSLSIDGMVKTMRIHTLVMLSFVGPRPENMECCHFDGNPLNNRLDNLRWGTSKDNKADSIRHGTFWPINRRMAGSA